MLGFFRKNQSLPRMLFHIILPSSAKYILIVFDENYLGFWKMVKDLPGSWQVLYPVFHIDVRKPMTVRRYFPLITLVF